MYAEEWRTGLIQTINEIRDQVGLILVIGDTPILGVSGPDCVVQQPDYAVSCSTPRATAVSQRILDVERAAAQDTGTRFADPTDWFCTNDACPVVIGGYLAYMDDSHFTIPFAESLASRLGGLVPQIGP